MIVPLSPERIDAWKAEMDLVAAEIDAEDEEVMIQAAAIRQQDRDLARKRAGSA